MMVSTPNVDNTVEVTICKFIFVVSDICCKVGWVAVCADKNFVFFAAEFGCFVPDCAVFFIGKAAVAQMIKGKIIDIAMDSRNAAWNWGRRNIEIYILDEK